MKRVYERPMMFAQKFAANEYVAACGDENKVYYFECDAPGGVLYYYNDGDGTVNGTYTGNGQATRLGFYYPCGSTHEAATTNLFYDGFVDRNRNGSCDDGEAVIVWRGTNGNNGHATAQLDMDSWQTAKS